MGVGVAVAVGVADGAGAAVRAWGVGMVCVTLGFGVIFCVGSGGTAAVITGVGASVRGGVATGVGLTVGIEKVQAKVNNPTMKAATNTLK